jgi:hypothetical protein
MEEQAVLLLFPINHFIIFIEFISKTFEGVHNTSEVQDVILEVEGSQSPPSFVLFNYVVSGSQISLEAEVSENTSDVQGLKNPEHMTGGSESPKTPWSQQREHNLIVPLNSVTGSILLPIRKRFVLFNYNSLCFIYSYLQY